MSKNSGTPPRPEAPDRSIEFSLTMPPEEVIKSIKFREPTTTIEAPFGTVVEIIRQALTERSVSAATYAAAVSLLGVPLLVDLIILAGAYAGGAALLTVFDMQLDPGETHLLPSLG